MKSFDQQLPLVVIFGRTNVGKSTLFNTLIEKRQALVSKVAGTTRDSNLAKVSWRGKTFGLVDTGGIIDLKYLLAQSAKTDEIEVKVQAQARLYLARADLILFLADSQTGLLPDDKQLALFLKKVKKPEKIILVANKVDRQSDEQKVAEFYRLGLGSPQAVSAANGLGTGDLLDLVVKKLVSQGSFKRRVKEAESQPAIRVCIIGKPNVGKSSLVNAILGYERVIVSQIPHTTREPQDSIFIFQDRPIKLIDTAGLSRKGKKAKDLEKFGIKKSIVALARSEIALLVLDISQPITSQDSRLVAEAVGRQKSLIIIANKWDLVKTRDTKKYTNYLYTKLPSARLAPIQFVSALTGQKVNKVLSLVITIAEQRELKLSLEQLDEFLIKSIQLHQAGKVKNRSRLKIHQLIQSNVNPPEFLLKVGATSQLHSSYLKFIEKQLRKQFGFFGTPITIKVIKKLTN